MARGGSGGGSKGGAQTVPYGRGGVENNRYQPPQQQPVMTGGPAIPPIQPQRQPSLGAGYGTIVGDMRANRGYQGLPQQQAFQQPQPFRQSTRYQRFQPPQFGGYNNPPQFGGYNYPPQQPSMGKGGSKGGGMSVPRNQFQPMPMMENPLGNRGMMRTMEMRPGRDYIPFMPPARQMQQQATNQGLGGFFR